ncbi:MAG: glycoside hydrolase family 1 protein [Caldilineales bacterium]|nr:glycoside hydrolase family 1 protein [Caldilineales bacterium]
MSAKPEYLEFPRGFLWGTATASHQVEGSNANNNWAVWEQEPGRILSGHKAGLACDWWGGRWREDFDRAAATGQNAHRLSIEWSRVQPAPDRWDADALDHYRQMILGLIERGLTPMVTLHHFTDPIWLSELGGWENDRTPDYFQIYVRKVAGALGDLVNLWCTVNEPNVYAVYGYLEGLFPPGVKSLRRTLGVMAGLVRGHAAAYHAIHDLQPAARVGMANHYHDVQAANPNSPLDRWTARLISSLFNDFCPRAAQDGVLRFPWGRVRLPLAQNTQDFLGLNYYTREYCAFEPLRPGSLFHRRFFRADASISPTGFCANEPEGFYAALTWARSFGLPIIITENGAEDAADQFRPHYLAQHIAQAGRAIEAGYPIEGYFHWSLLDNFEWERGWTQRFGLWELDIETQERCKRSSADLYERICRSHQVPRRWLDGGDFSPFEYATDRQV